MSRDPDLFDSVPPNAPPADEPGPKVWSVNQVNRAVRGLLDSSVEPLWVGGEVGSWTRSRAGHCYFTLKDDRAQLRGVIFARDAALLPTDPDDGAKVRAFGDLTLYEQRGEFQLVARKIEGEGKDGLWRKAFEALKEKLSVEGLLDPDRKRPLPRYPARVGVVTSPSGAALHDVISVLERRAPWTHLVVAGAKVQGEGAAAEIARAVDALGNSGLVDVMIVGRGGGSLEDLWAFNEEPVARALARCPVPTVSAVGHEVDVTIADLVADVRAPTPSAAAERVVPDRDGLRRQLGQTPERLARALRRTVIRPRAEVTERLNRLRRGMEGRLIPARRSLDLAADRVERGITELVVRRRGEVATLGGRLHALSPLATLARGYAVPRDPEGGVLRSRDDFTIGSRIHLRVTDAVVDAEVLDVHPEPAPLPED